MKKPDGPCTKECPYRSQTCHGECEDYKRFKEEMEKYKEAVRREKLSYYLANRRRRQRNQHKCKTQREWDARWIE